MTTLAAPRKRWGRRGRTPVHALFRRVCVINGLVFALGTLVLALSPATVSARVRSTELPVLVLVIGLAVILAANAFLLRSSLAPLDALIASMRRVDPPHPANRVDRSGNGDLNDLIETFNAMLDRLESKRSVAGAAALTAQEGKRQRIARELHDEIGQSLTVALLRLRGVVDRAPEPLREQACDAQETVGACLESFLYPGAVTALVRDYLQLVRQGRSLPDAPRGGGARTGGGGSCDP